MPVGANECEYESMLLSVESSSTVGRSHDDLGPGRTTSVASSPSARPSAIDRCKLRKMRQPDSRSSGRSSSALSVPLSEAAAERSGRGVAAPDAR